MRRAATVALLACAAWAVATLPRADAQVRAVYDGGAAGLAHRLGRLQTTASVLHTGAHPDDEDSAFIARAARGDHARVAYLSLTRGEGGQNIIGPELFEALGVIRTEELLQARRLDGGEQFFTRAFDYGFSKTLAEARAKWDEHEVLADMVRVIRTVRPLVVHSRFAGTPADGHGQHQFAGYLTPRAVAAAADPAQFPEQVQEGLRPWQARKLYRGVFRPGPQDAATTVLQTGALDPVIGRTYAAIAAEGRSQHKSQQMGGIEPLGPATVALRRVESRVGAPDEETSVFDGLDTSIRGLAALAGLPAGTIAAELAAIDDAASQALREFRPLEPERLVPLLASGLDATRRARRALAGAEGTAEARADADFLLAGEEQTFVDALAQAAGVTVDPLAERETIVAGDELAIEARVFLEHPSLVTLRGTSLRAPAGWPVATATGAGRDEPGFRRETPAAATRFGVRVPLDAAPTEPYFLRRPRAGDLYDWPPSAVRGQPFAPPLFSAAATMVIGGVELTVTAPVRYRVADRVRGELRREVNVVPPLALALDSDLLIVPTQGPPRAQRLVVHATSVTDRPLSGTLRLRLPEGWTSTPAGAPFTLDAEGSAATAAFELTPPRRRTAGTWTITAEAESEGRVFAQRVELVAYPHIQSHRLYAPAAATVQVFDLAVAPVRVGYIMGSGDSVPDALRRMGLAVTLLDAGDLAAGDLSRFDTIVVGVRASEARPDFVANQARLRQYMERGGTLIVQYQQTDYAERNLPPYPVTSRTNSRVTDETAAVRLLAPAHPLFTFPNRITAADFEGWVQERNLYAFAGPLDARYVPLLESADPGEAPQRGGEVYARVGRGHYVYTAYAWFRQLRAGVPGAYRQMANLVSLPAAR